MKLGAVNRRAVRWGVAVAAVLGGWAAATAPSLASEQHAARSRPACATTVNVVAHVDDDLLFVNPDIAADLAAGRCVTTVYLTAGDAGRSYSYWRGREEGARASYARMAGTPDRWTLDDVVVAGRPVHRATLDGGRVELLFLRLPDGGRDGSGFPLRRHVSLRQLWEGRLAELEAVDDSASYTRGTLVATLTAVLASVDADVVRTLDYAGGYDDGDHSDHHTAGYLTRAAHRAHRAVHRLHGYQGYGVDRRPANLDAGQAEEKLRTFLAYAGNDPHVCGDRTACTTGGYAPRFARRYEVGTERGGARPLDGLTTLAAAQAAAQAPAAQAAR